MTQPNEKPQDEQSCAAETLSIPQDEGEPCFYCADEHPQLKEEPKAKKPKRPKTRKPTETPAPKKKNWFSRLSPPWKIATIACGLLTILGLGKFYADLPQPPTAPNCSHQIVVPADGDITVAQADSKGNFSGRTTYQYQLVNGIKQLISAKRFSADGKLAAALTFTRDASGDSCLVQMATYDSDGKVSNLYSDTKLPDSQLLIETFDLWIYLGQLN
jgi:hypothetical protein